VSATTHMGPGRPQRSSIVVVVLITLLFASAALTALVEKAGNDLLVEVRQADARRLRQEAYSALEVTIAVLEDFRQADNGLHSMSEGWGDPLTWANWSPSEGRKVEISFQDESGKIPIAHADLTTLTNLFEAWQMQPSDAEKLADVIEGWMQSGYVYSTTVAPDYASATIPYAEPQRPLRAYSELAAIAYAKDVFFDENGLPNGYFWRFVDDVSLYKYPQPNINTANADVLAAVGQYADSQRQHIGDFLQGTGQYAQLGQQWFQDPTTLAAVAGVGGNANSFADTISALRVSITVHEGRSSFRLSAVVAPQGGATINQTAATNATAAASTSSTASTTSVTSTAQPTSTATSAQTSAAASQSINYPYTVLEMLEEDDIPLPPPPVTPQT
jgi:DNA uptake protein ComE-like DNA-binding protein